MAEQKSTITGEEEQAKLEMYNYVLGFTPTAVLKCAVELQLADVIEAHGGTMTHDELSAAVGCSPPVLRRIMRYLVHRRVFEQKTTMTAEKSPIISYSQTPVWRKLMTGKGDSSMAPLLLMMSSPITLAPWHRMSSRARVDDGSPFKDEHGQDTWGYARSDPAYSKLFEDGISCAARESMKAVVDQYPEAFDGISSLVDVGGGNGTALGVLVKAFPWIRGVNFDLPHVIDAAPDHTEGVEHVAGDMFHAVPKADAAILMSVLHDWNDEDCVRILRKCMEAIPADRGKVIIVDIVIREGDDSNEDIYSEIRISLDMAMLVQTTGKERSWEEWEDVLTAAGFSTFTVKHIHAVPSIIEAYPSL